MSETIDTAAARILKALKWGKGQQAKTSEKAVHAVASELVNSYPCDWTDAVAAAKRALAK